MALATTLARRLGLRALCLLLAGALVTLPGHARAAEPLEVATAGLVEMGVSPEEAAARLALLDEAEIATLAEHLESQPAGAGTSDVIVTFFIVTAVVFVVLIITDAAGVTDIFPWVKKPHER